MSGQAYQFRVDGILSPELITSFHPTDSAVEHGQTRFTCLIADDAQLFGIIGRCETLGLRLVALDRCTGLAP